MPKPNRKKRMPRRSEVASRLGVNRARDYATQFLYSAGLRALAEAVSR